jgi:signal transduction histidine kinase
MQDTQQKEKKTRPNNDAIPGIVDAILVFFYVIVWADLAIVTAFIAGSGAANLSYVPPLVLYACLLLSFPVRNWRRFRGGEGKLSDLLWGYEGQFKHQFAFVLLNFALVAWLSALNQNYANLYFMLLGVSAGLLSHYWQILWPVVTLEFVAFVVQSGVWDAWKSSGFDILNPAVAGFALGMILFIVYIVMITALIGSRLKSEALVVELRATQAQLEEALQTEKEVAVLRERDRMAREMHDVLGHALVLVAVKIEAAQRLQSVDPERAAVELEATKQLVRQSMADLRASLADMRSPEFDASSKPLSRALQDWSTRVAGEGNFAIQCDFEPEAEKLPIPVQDALWRVGREAVLNILKHARAHAVELNVFTKDGQVFLTVGDDGVGIPHLADGTARLEVDGHYGMRGMRERVEALGGHLTVRPGREGRGTMVIASMPLPATDDSSPSAHRPTTEVVGATQMSADNQNSLTPVVRRPSSVASQQGKR